MPNTVTSTPVRAADCFCQWQVDAITTSSMQARPRCTVLVYPGKTVFVLCCTSNPGAISLQRYPTDEAPFYLQIVKESNWGTQNNSGLETTEPDVLAGFAQLLQND